MSALVSVIIPVYNAEKYIENCLKSVINQTYKNVEIICVDDGSKDRSSEIIKNLSAAFSKIRYIFQKNAGVSAARNNGLSVAEGDFIVFLDSDDYIHPQTIELFIDCQKQTNADIVCCQYKSTNKTDEESVNIEKYSFSSPDFEYLFNSSDRIGRCVWGKLIKSEIAKNYKFPLDLKLGEDSYYMITILKDDVKVALIPEKLWYYYSNSVSLTHDVSPQTEMEMLRGFDRLLTELQKNNNSFLKGYVLESIYKSYFRIRSLTAGINDAKEVHKENKKYGKKWLKRLAFCTYIKPKKKITYIVFYCSRLIYEKVFILHDPSMKDYYQNLRKKS